MPVLSAYGWQVDRSNVDGHNAKSDRNGHRRGRQGGAAQAHADRAVKHPVIGKGSPNKVGQRTMCTARPWAPKEIAATRDAIGWNSPHAPFEIPAALIYEAWDATPEG